MSLVADLWVKLGFKSDEFNTGIDQAKQKTSSFGSAMGKIGGMIAGAFAIGAIVEFGKSSMEEFNKAEQGAMRLLTALGGNSRALDMLSNQAKDLQKTTLFEDDETIAAQAAMAMLVKEADKIKILTPLVQDLATAKGIDLTSAGFMVAKSVEGSAMALQKMGIQVEGTAGSAERFTSIVKELNKAVGGQAKNAADVGTGAMTQLANSWDNLKEAIGGGTADLSIYKYTIKSFTSYFEDQTAIMESKLPFWTKVARVLSGDVKGFSKEEQDKKETSDKWNKELHPEEKTGKAKPKAQTDAEQLADRIKLLKQNISDTTVEMHLLSASTPEWKTSADALKGFQDELGALTGSTKRQEEADKLAADAKANLVDRLIAQRIEEQKIIELQGIKITATDKKTGEKITQLDAKGEGLLKVPETKLAKLDTILADQKERQRLAVLEINQKALDDEKTYQEQLKSIISNGMADAIQNFTGGLADLVAGNIVGGEFGLQILSTVGSFMVQLGMMMITTSTIYKAFVASLASGGFGGIALGIALVAAGSAVTAFAKKGLSGGGSGGGGGGGSSAASGYSSGMQGQSTAGQTIQVKGEFELQGNKLVALINNVDRRNLNFK